MTAGQQWKVEIHREAERVLQRLPRNLMERIDRKIQSLASDPRPPGGKKLAGYDNLYRLRVGDWRISYAVEDEQLIVLIIEVASRGGAYRF